MSSVFEIVDHTTKKSCLIVSDIYQSFSTTAGAITDDLGSPTLTHKVDQANIQDDSAGHSGHVTGLHIGAMPLGEAARQGSLQARKLPGEDVCRQGSRWARGYLRIGCRVSK
jgi:hypothetical protein